MKRNHIITLVIIALVVVLALGVLFLSARDAKNEVASEKIIHITVDYGNGTSDEYTLKTTAKYLSDVLLENNIVKGEEGDYGIFITTVNGVKADEEQKQWWKVTKSGESVLTGISSINIADGDNYELTLTTGYDR